MKYIIVIAFAAFFLLSKADIINDKESGIIEVQYDKTSVSDTLKWRTHTDPMTLRIGATCSMFYPTKRMWADSLLRNNFELHEKLYRESNPIGKPAINLLADSKVSFFSET